MTAYLAALCLVLLTVCPSLGQERRFTPQEMDRIRQEAESYALERKLRALEIDLLKRKLESDETRGRVLNELRKHYLNSMEESRGFFRGRTIDEVISEARTSGGQVSPEDLFAWAKAFLAFKDAYMTRVYKIVQSEAPRLGEAASEYIAHAEAMISSYERQLFRGEVSRPAAQADYLAAVKERAAYDLLKKLTPEQRGLLYICEATKFASPACTEIARLLLK